MRSDDIALSRTRASGPSLAGLRTLERERAPSSANAHPRARMRGVRRTDRGPARPSKRPASLRARTSALPSATLRTRLHFSKR